MPRTVLDVLGVRVGIDGPGWLLAEVVGSCRSFASVVGSTHRDHTLWVTCDADRAEVRLDDRPSQSFSRDEVAGHVVERIHPLVAAASSSPLFVHAAVFAFGSHVVIVPGRSGSGKSTLTLAALDAGAHYYSDEFAPVDADGLVHPYPREIVEKAPGGPARRHDPHARGLVVGAEPRSASVVVETWYEPGARWCPQTLTGSRAALPIVDNTVRARSDRASTLRVARQLSAAATTLTGPRGEAAGTIDLLVDRLATLPPTSERAS